MTNELFLVGCASGLAGADIHSGDGPLIIQQSSFLQELIKKNPHITWDIMLSSNDQSTHLEYALKDLYETLAKRIADLVADKKRVCVVGGDHACAIGTWSGVHHALEGDLGLIWIDAHMDSHTPETSESGHIHGMPVACLMGYGYPSLTHILSAAPKIKPENLCLIGVRSFESGEAELLKKLNVRIYFMDEVKARGFKTVLQEAQQLVRQNTRAYGLSLDLDAFDPHDAPGVDVPEADGIDPQDFLAALPELTSDPKLILTEIVEFDPARDVNRMTEKLLVNCLEILAGPHDKSNHY
jgi:arginase